MAGLGARSFESNNNSQLSLLGRSQSEKPNGAFQILKEGSAKVKEEGGLFKMFSDRYLVLREYQLDFQKIKDKSTTTLSIQLRDVTNIARSEVHTLSFELTKSSTTLSTSSPPRDGPSKTYICKVETDEEVYAWIDSIYHVCPNMGGVSNPTNFTHRVHVGFDPTSGAFTGLPQEWAKLLTASAITTDDYARNPQAVVEVLKFYTEKLVKRAEDPLQYPSLMPTPTVEANKQLGHSSSGNSIAPPRPNPPNAFQRKESYSTMRDRETPSPATASQMSEKQTYQDEEARRRMEEEKRRRMDEEARRRRAEQDRREAERREREEQAQYNASLPKTREPMAKQEVSGAGFATDASAAQSPRYNPARAAPSAPSTQQPQQSLRQPQTPQSLRQVTAQRQAPSAPTQQNGQGVYNKLVPSKQLPSVNGQRQPSPGSKYNAQSNGQAVTEIPNSAPTQSQLPVRTQQPSAPKPLNVQAKAPTGAAPKDDAVKKAEQALTRKEEPSDRKKDARMSSMTEQEVMIKLREVVSKDKPLESYNKQKKIGQGASGSVYVARIKESAPSPTARAILREHGPKAQVAIKQMDLRNQPRKELIVNEIIVMKDSKHPNIVNFLDAFLQEEQSELWVVMEFMEGGALTDIIDYNSNITEDQIATVCLEVR